MATKNTEQNKVADQHPAADGGWGWAVVLGSHVCIFFGVGWLQTISIYLVPLQQEFGSSSATLGWIVSSGLAMTFLSGPLGSFCVRRIGCRKSCFLGGTILGCGFVVSVFVKTPLQLFFTIGMVTGIGCSLVHLSASIATSQYFEKRHALANGLTWLGSNIGQFVSAPFLQFLIDSYGWRGAVLIEGGLVFNTLVAAALFRPIHHIYKGSKNVACSKAIHGNGTLSLPSYKSTAQLLSQVEGSILLDPDVIRSVNLPTSQQASTNRASTLQLQILHNASNDGTGDNTKLSDGQTCPRRKFFRKQTFFLDTPAVLIVCVVNFLMAYAIQGYYAHVVAKAIGHGINQDTAAFILSTYAIGSLVARISHGWFIDKQLIKPLTMYALALSAGCVGAFSAVVAQRYGGFLASAIVLGMSSGVFYPIIPVVMRSLVGLKRMGTAYGVAMVFDGSGVVTGGLMAGLIKDITGDYNISFIQAGVAFALSTALILGLVISKKCESGSYEVDCTQPRSPPEVSVYSVSARVPPSNVPLAH